MVKENLTQLSNGLRVVTRSVDSFESVVLGYLIDAGAVCEDESNNGISHFLEHMAFKGTTTRSAKQIAEEIESVGGYSNAYTSRETTAFHAKVLKGDEKVAMDILSDILLNPVFSDDEMERERGVILQEISQTQDTPDDIIFDYFQNTAFPNQSMGRPILGPSEVVSKITPDDLRKYRGKYYNASNIVFGAVGNISHDEILELGDKYFCKFSDNKASDDCRPCNRTYSYNGGTFSDVRDLAQSHLIVGFDGVSCLSESYYTMAIFSSILGGGMSSRLFQEVREKRGLVYSVYSFASYYRNNGLFGIYAATSKEKLSEVADVAIAELMKMRDNITEEEFRRTKTQFKASLLMSQENNSSACEQIANQTMIFGRPLRKEDILTKINAVTIEDVKKLTDRVVSSNASVVTVGQGDASAVVPILKRSGISVE